MSQRFDNKIAVITGGASGIGEALSRGFAAEGATAIILDVNEENGNKLVAEIKAAGGKASFANCDITNQTAIQELFAGIKQEFGPIDALINNAGVAAIGNVEVCTEDDLDRVYKVNVKGMYNCLQAVIPQMKGRGGSIVNMASVASLVGIPDRFAYSMSKGAALTMTYSIATDYVKDGIRCNCLAPARVHTPFVDGFLAKNYPGEEKEMYDKLAATQPVGRMGTPEEIAKLALFLCSDDASFITGSCYQIDGGFCKVKI